MTHAANKRPGLKVVAKDRPKDRATARGIVVGTIVGVADGRLLVRLPDSASPVAARCALKLDAAAVAELVGRSAEAVVAFEREDPERPIVTGMLHTVPDVASASTRSIEAKVDGERVVIEGRDEVVLQCGKASITLRRNGRVVIRGTQLESRAQGLNRIRGGAVQIN
jgi:Domain of unknown function (DUF6484)